MARVPIEALSAELRSLRARLIRYDQRERHAWTDDLETYDRCLLDAAVMLEVEPPSAKAVLPLAAEARGDLEARLAAAGLEVRTDPL